MSVSTLVDLVKIQITSSGTSAFSLGAAVPGFRGVEALRDGSTYSYSVQQGSNYEAGTGTYIAATSTLSRAPSISSNGNAAVSFGPAGQIAFTALAADIVSTGAALPIVNALGNDPASAIGQQIVTNVLGNKVDTNTFQTAVNAKADTAVIPPLATDTLWANTDLTQGNPAQLEVYNNGFSTYGLSSWVAQQVTINPFMTVMRGTDEVGNYTNRMVNGLPSTSSVTIGTGSKTFTVAAGLNFAAGIDVTIAADANIAMTMTGLITSYSGTTLTVNVTSVTGSGTFASWWIGRIGTTSQAQTLKATTAASAVGSTTLTFANTTGLQVGAGVEGSGSNGIPYYTYVVSFTATTVTLSAPIVAPGITSGQTITFYGDQGVFLYQDIYQNNAGGFRNGTAGARNANLSFKTRSRGVTGVASIMALGYSTTSTLARSYAAPFPVTETSTRVTVPLLGDTVSGTGAWKQGMDPANPLYMALGFAPESQGTFTSKNIPPYQWLDSNGPSDPGFATAGCNQQTLNIVAKVGAWFEVSEVKLGFDAATEYYPPSTLPEAKSMVLARAPTTPIMRWEAQTNAADAKKWQAYADGDGFLRFGTLNDAETAGSDWIKVGRDGTVYFLGYPDGVVQVVSGRIATTPRAFIAYTAVAAPTSGSSTFGAITAAYFRIGSLVHFNISVPVTAAGTGAGAVNVSIPFQASGRVWSGMGIDGPTGKRIAGVITAGATVVQLSNFIDSTYPGLTNSTLNINGFYEAAS